MEGRAGPTAIYLRSGSIWACHSRTVNAMRSLMRRVLLDTRYTLVGFPTAVIAFVLLIAGMAAGVGTTVVWIGVPLLAGTLMIARGFADAERGWLSDVLKRPPVRPRYKPAP